MSFERKKLYVLTWTRKDINSQTGSTSPGRRMDPQVAGKYARTYAEVILPFFG